MCIVILYTCVLTTQAIPCTDNQHCASCGNGRCLSECDNGYYGPQCELLCSPQCLNNTCKQSQFGIEMCTHGCIPGFDGTRCNLPVPCVLYTNTCRKCPQECEGGFCQLGSSCARRCQDSYYGTACRSCPAECEVCNRISGTCEACFHCEGNCTHGCLTGCTIGYFGDFCEHSCSSRCLKGCNQTSGDCFRCISGWFGAICDKQCVKRCFAEECDMDGICTRGCIESWYGLRCESKCSSNCLNEECDMDTICTRGCIKGWYGPRCESKCGTGCIGGSCDRNGNCISGCKPGFYGEQCQNQCPAACLNKLCDIENGFCKSCEKGFYGILCNETCVTCIDGSCRQDTGLCIKGCLSSYRGEFCQHDCIGNCTTDECRDNCKPSLGINTGVDQSNFIRYWVEGSVVLVVVLALIFVTFRCQRNHTNKRRSRQNGSTEQQTERHNTQSRPPNLYCELDEVTQRPQQPRVPQYPPTYGCISPLTSTRSHENVENEIEATFTSAEFANYNSGRQDAAAVPVHDSSEENRYLTAFVPNEDDEVFEANSEEDDEDDYVSTTDSTQEKRENLGEFIENTERLYAEISSGNDPNVHVYVNCRGLFKSSSR